MLTTLASEEADVLLDARGKANEGTAQKNALVSGKLDLTAVLDCTNSIVLLREVEYFKGVLILTTNRVVAFDAAVLSRVHHAVNFGVGDEALEAKMFRLWFQRAKKHGVIVQPDKVDEWIMSFERDQKRSFCQNGREIRNVFLMTQDLHEDGLIRIDDLKRVYRWKVSFREEMTSKPQAHKIFLLVYEIRFKVEIIGL